MTPSKPPSTHDPAASSKAKTKILMLHGYTQSGPLFHSKTRALEKHLQRHFPSEGIELHYPTAPIRLHPADLPGYSSSSSRSSTITTNDDDDETITTNNTNETTTTTDAYAWWRRDERTGAYNDLDESLAYLAGVLRSHGPFDGVLGFSQGAAAAAMVAALLEPGRREAFAAAARHGGMEYPASFVLDDGRVIHPPLKFAVAYSGFIVPPARFGAFYDPPIVTPVLHFVGSLDTVVDERRSLDLVRKCEQGAGELGRLVYHPGGHFLPAQKPYLNCLVGFLRGVLSGSGEEEVEGGERKRESRI